MSRSVYDMIMALGLCFIISCSPAFTPDSFPTDPPRPQNVGQVLDLHPYCSDSVGVGLWAINCLELCIPRTQPPVVCHGNNEKHALTDDPNLKWIATLEPAEVSNCGVPAYRVWSVRLDTREPAIKDRDTFSTWPSKSTRCTALAPGQFFETDFFVKHSDISAYLLHESDEVTPNS